MGMRRVSVVSTMPSLTISPLSRIMYTFDTLAGSPVSATSTCGGTVWSVLCPARYPLELGGGLTQWTALCQNTTLSYLTYPFNPLADEVEFTYFYELGI
jgi:hypothetical protein